MTRLTSSDPAWPPQLTARAGMTAPSTFSAMGDVSILSGRKVALFCSMRCPGDAFLAAYDTARRLRDDAATVISGFHSVVEKECLRILLRGRQPIIVCPARTLDGMRMPTEWRAALEAGRLLVLSPFDKTLRRPTVDSARLRNEFVAVLADEVLIIHATPGGQIERISELVDRWSVPRVDTRLLGDCANLEA